MHSISIEDLVVGLNEKLPEFVRHRIVMQVVGDSGLSIKIDGNKCLTSIGVWPNGCCDVEFMFVSNERGEFKHFEFESADAAISPVLAEIVLAVERA